MADNHEMKIRKGQAFNLAVAEAIQQGKADDFSYILGIAFRFFKWADLFQSMDENTLAEYNSKLKGK